jgi:hypothetical protein
MKLIHLLALASLAAGQAAAQDTTRVVADSAVLHQAPLYRDPHRARLLGTFVPGAGHIYAGEYVRGYFTGVATIGSITLGSLIFQMNRCTFAFLDPSCNPGSNLPYHVAGALMVGEGVWAWISSARDASHAAERANVRHSSRSAKLSPLIEPSPTVAGQWNTGVKVTW